jgi:hypothetical protein
MLKLIIKNIVVTSAAVLQQIAASWKNIMRRRQLEMAPTEHAKSAMLN